jgi:hypothetical protein
LGVFRHLAGHFLEARFGTADPDCWWYGFVNTGWGIAGSSRPGFKDHGTENQESKIHT